MIAFFIGLLVCWGLINLLYYPEKRHMCCDGKTIRQISVLIILSLAIYLSFQLGRIEGHEDVYNYLKNGDELPEGSPFKSLHWNFNGELP